MVKRKMRDRIVYYGPMNNEKRRDFIDRCKSYIQKSEGKKFWYILPTRSLLTKYRKILLEDVKGVFDINVITFDDITRKLLRDELYTKIDLETKEEIISLLLEKMYKDGQIVYYRNFIHSEGFITSVRHIIGEIKRSFISPQKFIDSIPTEPFYMEIGLLYEKYQEFLNKNNLMDKEEEFFRAVKLLKQEKKYFEHLDFVVIDEFFDFRPQEMKLLKEMTKEDIDIYINIPYKFEKNFITVRNTVEQLADMNFKIEEVEWNKKNFFESIGDEIFTGRKEVFDKDDSITLIKASNKYLELKKISEEIKKLSKAGVELGQIAVVLTSKDEYLDILYKVFNEEKIPFSIDEEMKLKDVPLVREFLNIVELSISNFDKKHLINRIKSNYFSICEIDEMDKFEFMLQGENFENIYDLKEKLISDEKKLRYMVLKGKEEYEDVLEDLINLDFILDAIIDESKFIVKKGKFEDIANSLLNILVDYEVWEKILDTYEKNLDYNILCRDLSSTKKLQDIIQTMIISLKLTVKNEIDLKDFYNILFRYCEEETIVIAPKNIKGVNVLTPSTIRGLDFDTVFLTGLIQGEYPQLKENNFFFNDRHYPIFKDIGMDIKNFHERLDNESLLFDIAITRSRKNLYLSFSEISRNNESNIYSLFLDEFINVFKGEELDNKLNVVYIDMDYFIKQDISQVTTKQDLLRYLLYGYYIGNEDQEYFNIVEDELKEISLRLQCEIKRAEEGFNKYTGVLESPFIKENLRRNYKNMVFSISQLETYGNCPFKYMYDYVLELENMERVFDDFTPLDEGKIYHEVLRRYYERNKENIKRYILEEEDFNISEKEIYSTIYNVLRDKGVDKLDNIWNIRINIIKGNLMNLIKEDLRKMKKSREFFYPGYFEVEFGKKEEFILNLEQGDIKFRGKIDRIDVSDKGEKIIYDYKKSSDGSRILKEVEEGTSFQLPLYMMAGGQDVVGAGYINITGNKKSLRILKDGYGYLANKARNVWKLNKEEYEMMIDLIKGYMNIYIEGILNGDFRLKPFDAKRCVYCDYKRICRYKGI